MVIALHQSVARIQFRRPAIHIHSVFQFLEKLPAEMIIQYTMGRLAGEML